MAVTGDEGRLFTALALLSECLGTELDKVGGDRCYTGLWAGIDQPPIGFLDCANGKCGIAWVQPSEAYSSSTFPIPDQTASKCWTPMALQVTLGVARCVPRAPSREMYPDAQAMFDANLQIMKDMRAMQQAVVCCLPERAKDYPVLKDLRVSLGSWLPLAAAAGAGGGQWTAWIA